MKLIIACVIALFSSFGIGWKLGEIETGPEKPVVHHMKEGFICITYRETMICGQGTNTRPSQSEESGNEEHSLLSQTTPTISYSVQF